MRQLIRGGPRRPHSTEGRPLAAKKYLGQHFLNDSEVLAEIVAAAQLKPDDRVLEIGPGHGMLTSALAEAVPGGLVLALEKDYDLLGELRTRFKGKKNVKIVSGDILATPLTQILPRANTSEEIPSLRSSSTSEESARAPYKVVANIPYAVTSPIITKFLLGDYRGRSGEVSPRPESMTLLVQQEVAERLVAPPGERARGLLTVLVELFGQAQLVRTVPPEAFTPRPAVWSAVFHLDIHDPKANPASFHRLLKFGFANKRRQFHNALAGSLNLPQSQTLALLEQAGINPLLRAEQLTLDHWLALHQVVVKELL